MPMLLRASVQFSACLGRLRSTPGQERTLGRMADQAGTTQEQSCGARDICTEIHLNQMSYG